MLWIVFASVFMPMRETLRTKEKGGSPAFLAAIKRSLSIFIARWVNAGSRSFGSYRSSFAKEHSVILTFFADAVDDVQIPGQRCRYTSHSEAPTSDCC